MEKIKPKVLVIVGPTASGKSALAVHLAKKFDGEVISADSRQVYKGLDIGTGKITKHEMRGVPHYLLGIADPRKQFSVSDFVKEAQRVITMIYHSGLLPIVVGGTGFYIDALTGTINFPDVPPNKRLREKLSKKSTSELFEMLKKKDPIRAKTIDQYNKVRLIRALEIIDTMGKVPALFSYSHELDYRYIFIGLKPENLDIKIQKRLKERLDGMIKEGKKLHGRGITYKRMHELGLEYRYIGMYLQNKITKEKMAKKLYIEIRRYAKRQMTWFKRNKKIKWFTLSAVEGFKPKELKQIEKYVNRSLSGL